MVNSEYSKLPFVSVIVPMYNEEDFIEDCAMNLLNQDYPKAKFEIIIVNGNSTDNSPKIVTNLSALHPEIRMLENPKRIIPISLNKGIKAAKGDIIVRMDSHAISPPDYISTCVKHLMEKDVDTVGGIMIPSGEGYWGECIALATSSKFGIGNSKHRYSGEEGYDEAGWLGSFRKKTLIEIGMYDENMKLNEDDELNYRLKKEGKKVFRTPEIQIKYYPRKSLFKLWRQYFNYGYWKIPVIKRYGSFTALRHFIPAIFVSTMVLLLALSAFKTDYFILFESILLIYLVSSFSAAIQTGLKSGVKFIPGLPVVFSTLHVSYGVGFLFGFLIFAFKKLR